jgi:hypothetical protein
MTSRRRPAANPWRLVVLLPAVAIQACAPAAQPPLGRVCGTVTLDGAALANATVLFTPAGKGRTSQGVTDASGRYELRYLRNIPGANVDRHTVRITTGSEENGGREELPPRYHARTELGAHVVAGRNELDFDLQSRPP